MNTDKRKIKFHFGGENTFVAEAPEDITLKQLLAQVDKVIPFWGGEGLHSLAENEQHWEVDLYIDYESIKRAPHADCRIKGDGKEVWDWGE